MSTPVQSPPHRHAYSIDDYYRMAEAGILRPDDRVELIKGGIIDTEGYERTRTPETLARIEIPGIADIGVNPGGLF